MKGAKGFGQIYRRPRSPYWWIAYTYRGRQVRESTKTTSKQRAGDLLKERLAAVRSHAYVPNAGAVTVGELLDELTTHYTIHGLASARTIRGHIAAWKPKLGAEKAINVDLAVLNQVVREWQQEGRWAPATINKLLGSLRRAYMLGQQAKRVAVVPVFPRLPVHNVREGFFDKGDFFALLGHLADDGLRDFVEWAYWTGMRKAEIGKLTWAAFDRETWTLTLPAKSAKNRRARKLVLTRELRTIVERRLAARRLDTPLVFHRGGQRIYEFRKAWATAREKAGLEGKLFHDLRRTGVRNLIRAGVERKVAMAISGHRTESMFERYNIGSDDELRAAIEKVSDYVGQLPAQPKVTPLRRSE